MKKKEKMVCQIIRFRGKIKKFLVSIDGFASSTFNSFNTFNTFNTFNSFNTFNTFNFVKFLCWIYNFFFKIKLLTTERLKDSKTERLKN